MDRQVLIRGFPKIFVPLSLGSVAAGDAGTLVGTALDLGAHHTFFVAVPIMTGGIGEGEISLPVGYAEIPGVLRGELFLAVIAKLTRTVSPRLQEGAFVVHKFFLTAMTYPLLFAIGVALTPWDKLVAAFHPANLVTTVVTLIGTGWLVGKRTGLYPIEAAVVSACHSGQDGTGDVAISTAANRV